MAGMTDASTPVAGMPLPAQVAAPLLSGRTFMRGPGVDSSGAAIQLPATAPIGPTATAQAISAAVQRPDLPVASSVASGGMNGPTMTPQALVAAKQASVAPALSGLGGMLFGQPAIAAAQQANVQADQGNLAGALGSGLRATGDAAVHAYAAPVMAAGQGLAGLYHGIAGTVNSFAAGLRGDAPGPALPAPAVPVQVATPAAAPAIAPGIPAALNETQAAAVRQRFGFADPAPAAAGMPMPVSAPAAPAQTAFEKQNGLPGGSVLQTIAQARPSQRLGLITALSGAQQTSSVEAAKASVRDSIVESYAQDIAAARQKTGAAADAAVAAAKARYQKDMSTATNPAGATAALGLGSFQPTGQ